MNVSYYESPVGLLKIAGNDEFITDILFAEQRDTEEQENELIKRCKRELDAYFRKELRTFTVPVLLQGTAFQNRVWEALREIPYGQTASYAEIASKVGNPKAVRAVGGANHQNRLILIVPCHRVIGKDGSMTGFGGGIDKKVWLLNHEKET